MSQECPGAKMLKQPLSCPCASRLFSSVDNCLAASSKVPAQSLRSKKCSVTSSAEFFPLYDPSRTIRHLARVQSDTRELLEALTLNQPPVIVLLQTSRSADSSAQFRLSNPKAAHASCH
ncbi:uncharacterized [Tachysurus ichikawai]